LKAYNELWIGGEWVKAETSKSFSNRNPATGEEICRVPMAGKSDGDKAVAAVHKAFRSWSENRTLTKHSVP
jgi:acyl-CoA reductase-like NAD-dependent aldehyde dehydrogenase